MILLYCLVNNLILQIFYHLSYLYKRPHAQTIYASPMLYIRVELLIVGIVFQIMQSLNGFKSLLDDYFSEQITEIDFDNCIIF